MKVETTPPNISGGVSNQLVARYGISYEGGNNFISAAERGGVNENGLAAANFVIPTF